MLWEKLWHKVFELRYLELLNQVEKFSESHPDTFYKHRLYELLESVTDCIQNRIFQNPTAPAFLLGNTLGKEHRDWRRAKKGLPNRYRLFFKFSTQKRTIVLAWFNDEHTLRKDGAKTDVYVVFKRKLDRGEVPSNINDLIKESVPHKAN